MSNNNETLIDLVQACRFILQFSQGIDKNTFLEDIKTQSSILYQFIILGEAINKLSDDFIQSYPQIPFSQIRGMRNRITHEYKEVDPEIVWDTIQQDIPYLLNIIEPLLPSKTD
ncbi:MAG: DUF86 domain-containing protein [Microcystaceae cyanobacterium]